MHALSTRIIWTARRRPFHSLDGLVAHIPLPETDPPVVS